MRSILELPSEAKIRSILRKILFPKGLRCPECGSFEVRVIEKRYYCKDCRVKFSETSIHPLLVHMRISYQQFYLLLWAWQKKYQPGQAKDLTGLSHVTIQRWYDRFREHLPKLTDYEPLAGDVECDESFFGHKVSQTGQWVAGAMSRQSRQVRILPIKARDSGNLDRFILSNVKKSSLLFTDAYSAYYGIENFHDYVHEVGNHSKGNFGPTAMAENIWSRCDRFIMRVYQQVQKHRLPDLLLELQARFSKPELFANPNNYLCFALSAVPIC